MSLSVSNLSKTFTQGSNTLQILNGLSFSIPKGESLAILGQSGSGKSTLLSCLAGLERPDQGEIHLKDVNITDFDTSSMTRFRGEKIGIIFQQFHLMPHLTALENIALPLIIANKSNWLNSAHTLLEKVGLQNRADHYPGELSGGECQRMAIARALVGEPELLLADEPTGNLDAQTAETVMSEFFAILEKVNTTLVLVTHDEKLARRCRRVGRLNEGKIWF